MTCRTCQFVHAYGRDEGQCRRRAPVIVPQEGLGARWPIVPLTETCGEYAPRKDRDE